MLIKLQATYVHNMYVCTYFEVKATYVCTYFEVTGTKILSLQLFTCFATIPIAYIFSFFFSSHLIAYAFFYIVFYIPSVVTDILL